MKTIKSYRLTVAAILAVLALAAGIAIIWSSIGNNAFADNNGAQTEETNDVTEFSLSFEGIAGGEVPDFEAHNMYTGKQIVYTPGEYLPIDIGANISTTQDDGKVTFFLMGNDYAYNFYVYDPIGYDFGKISQTGQITEKTNIKMSYKIYEGTYTIDVTVIDDASKVPMPNIELTFYDKNWNVIDKKSTDNSGKCILADLTKDKAVGSLVITQEGFANETVSIESYKYSKDNHSFVVSSLTAVPDTLMNFNLKSKDENHQSFEVSLKIYRSDDPSVILQDWYRKTPSISYNMPGYYGEWKVSQDGVLTCKSDQTGTILDWTIKLHCKDGSSFDHITIDKGDGNATVVGPDGSFSIQQNDKLWLESFYKDAPAPGPEPEPTPDEDVNATPQTGDDINAFIPLAILAATCATVLIARRKINQS